MNQLLMVNDGMAIGHSICERISDEIHMKIVNSELSACTDVGANQNATAHTKKTRFVRRWVLALAKRRRLFFNGKMSSMYSLSDVGHRYCRLAMKRHTWMDRSSRSIQFYFIFFSFLNFIIEAAGSTRTVLNHIVRSWLTHQWWCIRVRVGAAMACRTVEWTRFDFWFLMNASCQHVRRSYRAPILMYMANGPALEGI